VGHYRPDQFPEHHPVVRERVENYDVIARHDIALMNYFTFWSMYRDTEIDQLYEKLVPMVFATPRREYSERDLNAGTDRRRTAMEWDGDFPPTQLERIVYPSISVTRLNITFDQVRFTYAPWRKLLYSDDLNMIMAANFPLPYNFSYQFDFWALNQVHLNMFMEQWARKFPRPTHWLDVDYPPPWFVQGVHMQSDGLLSNTSMLEGGEDQRQLRMVATVNVFGWIPLPTRWVRTVQKLSIDLIEESSQEILEVFETEYASKQDFWETGDQEQVLVWK
jgi:hypothetical protein